MSHHFGCDPTPWNAPNTDVGSAGYKIHSSAFTEVGGLLGQSAVRALGMWPETVAVLMQYVPVDTIICFRASCPIVIAIIEYFYLDRELPSLRSWGSLIGEPPSC